MELLKLWILPLVVYPAHVLYPTAPVISTLRTIYNVALRLNSWGIAPCILSLPRVKGGHSLAQPKPFLLWQHATPFAQCARSPSTFPKRLQDDLITFADRHGFPISLEFLPFFQMRSNVVWNTMPYLAWSARAFSIVCQGVPAPAIEGLSYDTPLWHSCLIKNEQNLSYFSPALIRAGITAVGSLPEDDANSALIAPSWREGYISAIQRHNSPSTTDASACPPHSLWTQWTLAKMVGYLSAADSAQPRQSDEVWKLRKQCI